MKKRILLPLVVIVSMLLLPTAIFAQSEDPDAVDAPIDGGLSLLLAAGVGYGAKKAYQNKKKKDQDNN